MLHEYIVSTKSKTNLKLSTQTKDNILIAYTDDSGIAEFGINVLNAKEGKYFYFCFIDNFDAYYKSEVFVIKSSIKSIKLSGLKHNHIKQFEVVKKSTIATPINFGNIFINFESNTITSSHIITKEDVNLELIEYTPLISEIFQKIPEYLKKTLDLNITNVNSTLSILFQKGFDKFLNLSKSNKNEILNQPSLESIVNFVRSTYNNSIEFNLNLGSLIGNYEKLVNNQTYTPSTFQLIMNKLVNLFTVHTKSVFKPIKLQNQPIYKAVINEIQRNKINQIKITNYNFVILPGKYLISASINGIHNQKIIILDVSDDQQLTILFLYLLIALSCISVPIFAASTNSKFWGIPSILILIIVMFLNFTSENILLFSVSNSIYSIILLLLVYLFLQAFLSKKGTHIFFSDNKAEIFHEYTFQRLFETPSNSWILRIKEKKEIIESGERRLSESLINTISNKSVSENQLDDSQSNENKSHLDSGFFVKFKRAFTPFYLYKYRLNILNDCIFYPTRFLAGITITFIAIAYLATKFFLLQVKIIAFLDYYAAKIIGKLYSDTFLLSLNVISVIFFEKSNQEVDTYVKQVVKGIVNFFSNNINSLIKGIEVGLIVSLVAVCLVYLVNLIILLFDFKQRVILYRRNKPNFQIKKYKPAFSFLGNYVWKLIFSFNLIIIIVSVILSILILPITWLLIKYYMWEIIRYFAFFIINYILGLLIPSLISNTKFSNFPKFMAIFDLYYSVSSLIVGLMNTVKTFLIMTLLLVNGMLRIDQTPLNQNLASFDNAHYGYLATVKIYHLNHNPIAFTFKNYVKNKFLNFRFSKLKLEGYSTNYLKRKLEIIRLNRMDMHHVKLSLLRSKIIKNK